jgi:hypothetical protein
MRFHHSTQNSAQLKTVELFLEFSTEYTQEEQRKGGVGEGRLVSP